MDPDAALQEIRQIITEADDSPELLLERLPDLIQGLDDWISGGGFLPAAWQVTS